MVCTTSLSQSLSRRALARGLAGGAAGMVAARRLGAVAAAPPAPGHPSAPTAAGYRLPPGHAQVISLDVNGPGSIPQSEQGHSVTIDATGQATITTLVTPGPGTSMPNGVQPVATRRVELGVQGLRVLLARIAATGFFALPLVPYSKTVGELYHDLTVTLADGAWGADGTDLVAAKVAPAPLLAAIAAVDAAVGAAGGSPVAPPAAASPGPAGITRVRLFADVPAQMNQYGQAPLTRLSFAPGAALPAGWLRGPLAAVVETGTFAIQVGATAQRLGTGSTSTSRRRCP